MQFQKWKGLAMLAYPDWLWMTRRVAKEGEIAWVTVLESHREGGWKVPWQVGEHAPITMVTCRGRIKWQVGRTYAIQTGRGIKAIGRFELLAIRREPLRDISEQDIIAEGVEFWPDNPRWYGCSPRTIFAELWDRINKRKGKRWRDNPDVWPLTIRVVKEAQC